MASIAAISWAGPAHPPGVEWQNGQGPPPGVALKGNSRNANDCGKFLKVCFTVQTTYVLTFHIVLSLASIPSWMIAGNRIQGGTDAQAPIPWQVAVRFNGNKYCGGTIIDAKTIVTAAHCINQQWTLHDVAAGSTNYNQFPQVSKKIILQCTLRNMISVRIHTFHSD